MSRANIVRNPSVIISINKRKIIYSAIYRSILEKCKNNYLV